MAQSVLHSAQTAGGSATNTLGPSGITATTAGNLLVVFVVQTSSTAQPSISDNINGSTGWTFNATKSTFVTSLTGSCWVCYRIATGGETTYTATAGAGGTVQGLSYFEVTGNANTIVVDTIVGTNAASGSVTTITSGAVTTSDATSIILACAEQNGPTGTITAWSGTGPMANTTTTGTRAIGGNYVPGSTLSGVTFTANWTTGNQSGMLVIAIKGPAVASSINYIRWQPPFLS
jgi:hypothetical protein